MPNVGADVGHQSTPRPLARLPEKLRRRLLLQRKSRRREHRQRQGDKVAPAPASPLRAGKRKQPRLPRAALTCQHRLLVTDDGFIDARRLRRQHGQELSISRHELPARAYYDSIRVSVRMPSAAQPAITTEHCSSLPPLLTASARDGRRGYA